MTELTFHENMHVGSAITSIWPIPTLVTGMVVNGLDFRLYRAQQDYPGFLIVLKGVIILTVHADNAKDAYDAFAVMTADAPSDQTDCFNFLLESILSADFGADHHQRYAVELLARIWALVKSGGK